MRIGFVLAIMVFWSPLAEAAPPEGVSSCARVEADGSRTLCHEGIVQASASEVWRLFATSDGLASWAAPVAAIDLRVGGVWEASYRRDGHIGDPGNIRNRVLSYLPGRMLSIQVERAPPGFPNADLVRTVWTVIELEPVAANETRVRVSMTGYGQGAGYDALYAEFDEGNAFSLGKLRERISSGRPLDWGAPRGQASRAGGPH